MSEVSPIPPVAAELAALRQLIATLDAVAAGVDSEHRPLGQLDETNDDDVLRAALLSRARSCVITILQRGGPDDLREVAIAVGEALQGRAPEPTPETLWARLDELAQIPSTAASRIGPSAVEQTLKGWNGKSQHVINVLAADANGRLQRSEIVTALAAADMTIGDTSALSKILGELDGAGLIRRWSEGRTTVVELTTRGREHANPSVQTSPRDTARPSGAKFKAYIQKNGPSRAPQRSGLTRLCAVPGHTAAEDSISA